MSIHHGISIASAHGSGRTAGCATSAQSMSSAARRLSQKPATASVRAVDAACLRCASAWHCPSRQWERAELLPVPARPRPHLGRRRACAVLRGDAALGARRERERRQLQAQRGVVGQAHQAVQVRAQEAQPQALRMQAGRPGVGAAAALTFGRRGACAGKSRTTNQRQGAPAWIRGSKVWAREGSRKALTR